jgi:chitodextrinase
VDYVFDTAAPIDPEDGGVPPTEDTSPPTISDVSVTPSSTSAEISWGTNESTTGRVDYGTAAGSYDSSQSSGTTGTAHTVTLTGLTPETTYHFVVHATDAAGNTSVTQDATFSTTTDVTSSGPVIDVWYGDTQTFGIPAQAQQWANVVGNVRDADGVSSLSYKLNGGSSKGLSIGPNNRRLQDPGDFNIDIPWTSLQPGTNTVTITAVDGDGDTTSRSVTLVKESGGPLALPYTLSWSTSQPLQEQAQVVDGRWAAGSGGTVRTVQFGYDRLLAVGDLGWTDFEVTVPVTVHALGPGHNSYLSGAALVGIGLRWQGHTQVKNEQPAYGWWPTGAFAWHRFYDSGGRYELRGNDNSPVRHTTQPLTHGTTYVFKARAHTQSAATRYSFKWWVQGQPEPALWLLEIDEDAGPATGSVVLVAHHVDATFGTVTATPVSAP